MARTHSISTNRYGVNSFVVSTTAANGDYTTLASAMADAVSGDTIFLRDSVTENVTITPGVNIAAWAGGSLNTPSITGTLTMTGAGTSTISGLKLTTNSAAIIAVTGSAASILNVINCYLNCSNNTGITFSTSSASARINFYNCSGDLGTTGIGLFSCSSAGSIYFLYCYITNSGGSSTASTISSGGLNMFFTQMYSPITSSSTSSIGIEYCYLDTSAQNATCLTHGGSGGSTTFGSTYIAGTASAISISQTLTANLCVISSSNANAVTGAGTLNYAGLTFLSSSKAMNTTTQVGGVMPGGRFQAPSVGFIGERLTANATAVSVNDATDTNITSVSLTAGVWDVSGMCDFAGSITGTSFRLGINSTSATLPGTGGVNQLSTPTPPTANSNSGLSICPQRVVLTSTTTYYLVCRGNYSAGTLTVSGIITATRVG